MFWLLSRMKSSCFRFFPFSHAIYSREAEHLVAQRIHPQTIAAGWRLARNYARKALEDASIDNSSDPVEFRQDLFRIARTTLSSKLVLHDKDYFANLAVDAVLRLKVSQSHV